MRRPAQCRPGLAAAHGQALVYTDPLTTAILFNNDGGGGGGSTTPPAATPPSPAEVAARAAQQQPPNPAAPPAAVPPPGEQEVTFTQRRLNKMMSEEKEEGRRAAYRAIAEAAGIDPDAFDPTQFGDIFKQAEAARQQQLSEEQRRTEELQRREQALQAREDAAAQREKEAADRDRASRVRAALVKLGATGDDLEDAAALLRVADDASDDDIAQAAEKLKERRAEMFGGIAPQTLPPAPSGGPAGGNAPRQPTGGTKDAVKEEARKWADRLGYGNSGSSAA